MSDGKEFPSDKADKFVVRFPDGMREKIRAAAEANNRSMNAEIIARLQESFVAETEFHSSRGHASTTDLHKVAQEAVERANIEHRKMLADLLKSISSADAMQEVAKKMLEESSITSVLKPKK